MLILTDEQKVTGKAVFTDAKGKPAKVDGTPVWASSNETAASAVADPNDPFSVIVTGLDPGTDPAGTVLQISCTADADLGEGTTSVVLTADVTVVAGQAVGGTINFGAPEAQ